MAEFYRVCYGCAHYERGDMVSVMEGVYAHTCKPRQQSNMTAAEEAEFITTSLRRMGLTAVTI